MRYQSAGIRISGIARALESKRETRRSSVTEDASDPSEVDRELGLDCPAPPRDAMRPASSPSYGLILILPGDHQPKWVAVPRSSSAGWASTRVSNLRREPQSRPQSWDR